MTENVYWVIELAVSPGCFEDLKTLNAELVEATQKNEPGMLDNHWAISDDRQVCHIYERFQDSAAVVSHLQWFGPNFSERFIISSLNGRAGFGFAIVPVSDLRTIPF